LVGLVSTK
jgi:hypothetical protein